LLTFCDIWTAAGKYCAPWLLNQVANAIIDRAITPALKNVRYVDSDTISEEPLRTLIIDLAAWKRAGEFFDKINQLPAAAIGDLCGA